MHLPKFKYFSILFCPVAFVESFKQTITFKDHKILDTSASNFNTFWHRIYADCDISMIEGVPRVFLKMGKSRKNVIQLQCLFLERIIESYESRLCVLCVKLSDIDQIKSFLQCICKKWNKILKMIKCSNVFFRNSPRNYNLKAKEALFSK